MLLAKTFFNDVSVVYETLQNLFPQIRTAFSLLCCDDYESLYCWQNLFFVMWAWFTKYFTIYFHKFERILVCYVVMSMYFCIVAIIFNSTKFQEKCSKFNTFLYYFIYSYYLNPSAYEASCRQPCRCIAHKKCLKVHNKILHRKTKIIMLRQKSVLLPKWPFILSWGGLFR